MAAHYPNLKEEDIDRFIKTVQVKPAQKVILKANLTEASGCVILQANENPALRALFLHCVLINLKHYWKVSKNDSIYTNGTVNSAPAQNQEPFSDILGTNQNMTQFYNVWTKEFSD